MIVITLSAQLSSLAGEVVVKPGDTLSSLANYYNVSLESIIDSNAIKDPDSLRVGQKLTIPNQNEIKKEYASIKHIIRRGETIESISILYKIDKIDIIKLNNLEKPSLIYEGQSILIPNPTNLIRKKSPSYHIVLEGETLYHISKKYKLPLDHIIEVNDIKDPNNLNPGLKILLDSNNYEKQVEMSTKDKKQGLRRYGVLKVNWSSWKKFKDNSIALAFNDKGKPLYLAVNCYSSKINWKKINGEWNQWLTPRNDFEFNLLDDLCENTSEF